MWCVSTRLPRGPTRQAAALVEMAIILPIYLLLLLAMIEFGRAFMVNETLVNASREGARRAILPAATQNQVETVVRDYLQAANLPTNDRVTIRVSVNQQVGGLAGAQRGDEIKVEVLLPYSDVALVTRQYLGGGQQLSGSSVMRKE